MSLVAYTASSDEESENEDNTPDVKLPSPVAIVNAKSTQEKTSTFLANGHISDEDDDYVPVQPTSSARSSTGIGFLSLPKPKNAATQMVQEVSEPDTLAPVFAKLPMPQAAVKKQQIIEEEDDEFLHKKESVRIEIPKPPPPPTRVPVKITIPSMKDFSDVDEELAKSGKKKAVAPMNNTKRSGLLTMLPQAKSEQNFAKNDKQQETSMSTTPATTTSRTSDLSPMKKNSLIPDTVRNRRPAHNTEGVDGVVVQPSKHLAAKKANENQNQQKQPKVSLVQCSDSEASDDEPGDFFSLNDDEKLPEVNANELSVMVAKRAAKMAETTTRYLEVSSAQAASNNTQEIEHDEEELRQAQKRYHERELNEEALHALVGSSSKRRRQQRNEIEIVDISSHQVLPDREEWMRTALASQTTYQPTGVLNDDEPVAGTRRKHQITYLAHKAKANEAELQAMWSANRQTRRATQSKYGF